MQRRLAVAVVTALALVGAWATTAGAGLNPIITGVATCNTTTGQYDVVWTMTDVLGAGPFDVTNPATVTATPGAVDSNVSFSPTTVAMNGTATASGPVPGTTTSAHISVFAHGAPRNFDIDADDGLVGTCVAGTGGGGGESSAAAALLTDPGFTG